MNKSLVKQFNIWRVLAIVAMVCTITLVFFLCAESLKPGEQSGQTSGDVTEDIKDIINVPDNDQNYDLVSIRCSQSGASRCVGETLTLSFVYTPAQATNKTLTFVSSNSQIASVSDDGVVTFNSYGECYVTASSKANPNIKTTFKLVCDGVVAGDISTIYPTFDAQDSSPTYQVPEGTYSYIGFRDGDGQVVAVTTLNVQCDNPDVLRMDDTNHFVAIKPGTAKITVTNKSTNQTKDIVITVTPSDTFDAPETFVFQTDVLYVDKNTTFDPRDNISAIFPVGATFDKRFCSIKCLDKSLFDITGETYTATKLGETYFEITSYASGEVSRFKVVVVEPLPKNLSIIGNDRIVQDAHYQYTAFDGERDCDNVVWSVVKGNATITPDGKLVANGVGNVVIRATSTQDATIYADMKIRVSMFENFHSLVRKMIGHFSAFAVLGVGFVATFFLLGGRLRKLSPLLALLSSVFVASLTEILQMPIFTPNRGPSLNDVLLDSAGSLCGVIIAVALICVIFAIIKLANHAKYYQTKHVLSKLSFKTMFFSAKILFADVEETTTTIAQQEE